MTRQRRRQRAAGWGAALAALALCLPLAGCGEPRAPTERSGVITMAPNITATVFALGRGDEVVGVTSFCADPPEVQDLPSVGGYIDPDLERITRLAPRAILLQGRHEKVAELARRNNIEVVSVPAAVGAGERGGIAAIYEGLRVIGKAVDAEEEAEALIADIEAELDAVRQAVEGRSRPRVLFINSRTEHSLHTLYTLGGPSFVTELIAVAGGESIYADASQPYLDASKETVVRRAPEVIVEYQPAEGLREEEEARYKADWNELASVPAVRDGRIYLVKDAFILSPGPRIADTARLLAGLLHPGAEIPEGP